MSQPTPVTLSDQLTEITEAIVSQLDDNKASLVSTTVTSATGQPVTVQTVYYGDQSKIPAVPSVCVEPGNMQRTPSGSYQRSQNDFTIYIMIYHAGPEDETTRRQTDQIAQAVVNLLHEDLTLRHKLVNGFVGMLESGYTYRGNTLYRSARLTYNGMSRTNLQTS